MTTGFGPEQAARLRRAEARWLSQSAERLRRHADVSARRTSSDGPTEPPATEETSR